MTLEQLNEIMRDYNRAEWEDTEVRIEIVSDATTVPILGQTYTEDGDLVLCITA